MLRQYSWQKEEALPERQRTRHLDLIFLHSYIQDSQQWDGWCCFAKFEFSVCFWWLYLIRVFTLYDKCHTRSDMRLFSQLPGLRAVVATVQQHLWDSYHCAPLPVPFNSFAYSALPSQPSTLPGAHKLHTVTHTHTHTDKQWVQVPSWPVICLCWSQSSSGFFVMLFCSRVGIVM